MAPRKGWPRQVNNFPLHNVVVNLQILIFVVFFQAKFKVQENSDKKGCIIECHGIGLQNLSL